MVFLPEKLFAQYLAFQKRVFLGCILCLIKWNLKYTPSAGLHHPKKLVHYPVVVLHVLQQVVGHHHIKSFISKRYGVCIKMIVGPRAG